MKSYFEIEHLDTTCSAYIDIITPIRNLESNVQVLCPYQARSTLYPKTGNNGLVRYRKQGFLAIHYAKPSILVLLARYYYYHQYRLPITHTHPHIPVLLTEGGKTPAYTRVIRPIQARQLQPFGESQDFTNLLTGYPTSPTCTTAGEWGPWGRCTQFVQALES